MLEKRNLSIATKEGRVPKNGENPVWGERESSGCGCRQTWDTSVEVLVSQNVFDSHSGITPGTKCCAHGTYSSCVNKVSPIRSRANHFPACAPLEQRTKWRGFHHIYIIIIWGVSLSSQHSRCYITVEDKAALKIRHKACQSQKYEKES